MILVTVHNQVQLAQQAKGGLATVLEHVSPELVTSLVEGSIRDQLAQALASQGVQADVTVIDSAPAGSSSGGFGEIGRLLMAAGAGVAIGVLATGG